MCDVLTCTVYVCIYVHVNPMHAYVCVTGKMSIPDYLADYCNVLSYPVHSSGYLSTADFCGDDILKNGEFFVHRSLFICPEYRKTFN